MEFLPYHLTRPLTGLKFLIVLFSADSKCKTVNQTTSKDEGDSDSEELSQSLLPQVTWNLVSHVMK